MECGVEEIVIKSLLVIIARLCTIDYQLGRIAFRNFSDPSSCTPASREPVIELKFNKLKNKLNS